MRLGRLTQTAWNRSVKRQLHIGNAQEKRSGWAPTPWQECAVSETDLRDAEGLLDGAEMEQSDLFWAEASVQGREGWIGYYAALHAAGNLVAAGAVPSGLSGCCYLPEEAGEDLCGRIAASMHEAGRQMGVEVRAFRGETMLSLGQPVIHVTAVGRGDGRSRRKCEPEQEILFCGYAGLEGMLRLLEEAGGEPKERFRASFLAQAASRRQDIVLPGQIMEVMRSCVKDGVSCVTAARQVTEGGILAHLWHLAEEQEIGFDISMKKIALLQETVELCEFYGLNPYQMTSAGSYLLIVTDADMVLRALEKVGARAGRLGVVRAQKARMITSGEEIRYLDRPAPDELIMWRRGR